MDAALVVGTLVVGTLVLVVLLTAVPRLRAARARRGLASVDPRDRAELDALGATLVAEHRASIEPVLVRRLRTLAARGVPVNSVEPTGIHGQWIVRFADATPLVVRERHAGDMAVLGVRLLSGRVNLATYEPADAGVVVEVTWRGGGLRLLAVA